MRFGSFALAVLLAASPNLLAARPSSVLDEKGIHATYTNGEFEATLAQIEAFTRSHPEYSQADSVFIAKHLAVIYTANPATREKGKHYMFRLLELLPSAKIVDMFVSDEIDRIFERVKEEFLVRQRNLGKIPNTDPLPDSAGKPASLPATAGAKPASRSNTVYWWMGGTALVAATGAVAYFLVTDRQASPKDKFYAIPH